MWVFAKSTSVDLTCVVKGQELPVGKRVFYAE